jgi:hypothetical protein
MYIQFYLEKKMKGRYHLACRWQEGGNEMDITKIG